jgi:hypothetical protein
MGFCTILKKNKLILRRNIIFFSVLTLQLSYFPLTGWHYLKMFKSNAETLDDIIEGLVRYWELKPIIAISVLV